MPDDNIAKASLLRQLPGVDRVLSLLEPSPGAQGLPRKLLVRSIQETLEALRARIRDGHGPLDQSEMEAAQVAQRAVQRASQAMQPNLRRTINATGVVVHTNLGRSRLAEEAMPQLQAIACHYSNLEYDLETGKRGSRYDAVAALLCEITGAEAGLVVNNCAAAVLLTLDTLARDREVIVSRGELVEIGGSFRVPDIMAKSGADLPQPGTAFGHDVRDAKRASDFHQLAAGNDDFPIPRQGVQGKENGGSAVVDHQPGLGPGDFAQQGVHGVVARSPLAGFKIVLQVGVATGDGLQLRHGGGRQA